jgi:hypothetical protein
MELRESLKAKSEEGDAFIAEIEVIGQAYEDMQTQNQRLLQQITERDDFNTQVSVNIVFHITSILGRILLYPDKLK